MNFSGSNRSVPWDKIRHDEKKNLYQYIVKYGSKHDIYDIIHKQITCSLFPYFHIYNEVNSCIRRQVCDQSNYKSACLFPMSIGQLKHVHLPVI